MTKDLRAEIVALVGAHVFDMQEWDTGVRKCRHPDHLSGYSAGCHRAWLREQFPDLFPEL